MFCFLGEKKHKKTKNKKQKQTNKQTNKKKTKHRLCALFATLLKRVRAGLFSYKRLRY